MLHFRRKQLQFKGEFSSPKANREFRPWDFVCLGIATIAVFVWRVAHSERQAYWIAGIVMVAGYEPMIAHIIRQKRNDEPFPMWVMAFVIGLLLLIPPVRKRNRWGIFYMARAVICMAFMLLVMSYFQFFGPR